MDSRKESLVNIKLCRFCLSQDDSLSSLYDRYKAPKEVSLSLKVLSSIGIDLYPSDKMPQYICQQCKFFLDITYGFKQIFRQADENILLYVQKGKPLLPIQWPGVLKKVFKAANKGINTDLSVVETVTTQSGETVQVMAEEVSDDEEEGEDDSIYNVKVGDGPEQGKRIKIVTSDKPVSGKKVNRKEFSTVSKLTRHLKAHAGERPYPCKHCDKSFIKSHHYTRHLRVKHGDTLNKGNEEAFRCEECEETFASQDELIYHSALHATRNLVCPLCQEKFDDVDTVTAHIKSHVNGYEFMCDFCELIFTSKEKLETHVASMHEDEIANDQEMEHDESSMEMDAEDDDDNSINVKEENGHMVVEIKKADEYMLPPQSDEEKKDNTQSEDSEMEAGYEAPPSKGEVITPSKVVPVPEAKLAPPTPKPDPPAVIQKTVASPIPKPADSSEKASILKKAEEIKRKLEQQSIEKSEKKLNNNNKVDSSSSATGASEKSLKLLEKELQDLKRTNTRNEAAKTPAKPLDRKRPQLHTSTPKTRNIEKKEVQTTKHTEKQVLPEKKIDRRPVTKDIKDPKDTAKETRDTNKQAKDVKDVSKDSKETKTNSAHEEKPDKDSSIKEDTPKVDKKETKDKDKVKNGVNEKPQEEVVRRSTRPSKVKDYAKMIRDNRSSTEDDSEDNTYEDEKDSDKSTEQSPPGRGRGRRPSKPLAKGATPSTTTTPTTPTTPATPAAAPKKRGRPRKSVSQTPTPAKVRKEESPEETETAEEKSEDQKEKPATTEPEQSKPTDKELMVSPTGQTLKKVPIKSLPPGIKPMPLPRPMGAGEVCEMQIGKKVVKVQKIVMTKAEVEEMAKKGLVEMKDGTMVLKQGIKLPGADPSTIKSTIMGDGEKSQESPKKE